MPSSTSNAWQRGIWGLWLLLAALWMATLPRPLFDPDEGRYAEIPREMAQSGDWVTPRLNDLKYLEKPPLQYWATAGLYEVFGVNEGTSRLWSCALAFLCLPMVYAFAMRIGHSRDVALVAAMLLAVNPAFVICSQVNLLDQAFTFFVAGGIFAFALAQRAAPRSAHTRNWMLLAWTSLALAVLSKGIVALVLTGATVVLYMIVQRDQSLLRRMHLGLGVPLLAAIVVPWHWLAQSRNPEFAQYYFVHEHFARFLTTVHDRAEPWWYFPVILLFALLPVIYSLRPRNFDWARSTAPPGEFHVERFLLIWCAVVFLFYSISQSKLPPYILPMMPPLAVLLARAVSDDSRASGRTALVLFVIFAILSVGLVGYGWKRNDMIEPALAAWAAVGVLIGLAALVFVRRGRSAAEYQWIALGSASIAVFQALIMAYAALPPTRTGKMLAAQVIRHIDASTPLYSVGQFRHSLAFYLGRTSEVYAFTNDLEFGLAQAGATPQTRDAIHFRERWEGEEDAIAFVDPKLHARLVAAGIPGRVLAQDRRTVVMSRR